MRLFGAFWQKFAHWSWMKNFVVHWSEAKLRFIWKHFFVHNVKLSICLFYQYVYCPLIQFESINVWIWSMLFFNNISSKKSSFEIYYSKLNIAWKIFLINYISNQPNHRFDLCRWVCWLMGSDFEMHCSTLKIVR